MDWLLVAESHRLEKQAADWAKVCPICRTMFLSQEVRLDTLSYFRLLKFGAEVMQLPVAIQELLESRSGRPVDISSET